MSESSSRSKSGPSEGSGDVFDVDRVRALVELMHEHELNEINLSQGSSRIKIRRGGQPVVQAVAHLPPQAGPGPGLPPGPTPGPSPGPGPNAEPPPPAEDLIEIKSPMVGTFYSASSPDVAPYVKIGDQVGPDTTVCMVEAMKLFNEVPAECSGTIVAVCVENGDPVEYKQVLFRVRPA